LEAPKGEVAVKNDFLMFIEKAEAPSIGDQGLILYKARRSRKLSIR
jgi:hypothetical protein